MAVKGEKSSRMSSRPRLVLADSFVSCDAELIQLVADRSKADAQELGRLGAITPCSVQSVFEELSLHLSHQPLKIQTIIGNLNGAREFTEALFGRGDPVGQAFSLNPLGVFESRSALDVLKLSRCPGS